MKDFQKRKIYYYTKYIIIYNNNKYMIFYYMLNTNKILLISATINESKNNQNDCKLIPLVVFNDNINVQYAIIYCRNS